MRAQHIRWLAAGFLLPLFLSAANQPGQPPASKTAMPTAQSSRWITHTDPQLYSVESPPGWTVSPDKQKGWVHLTGTEGEHVVIWPVFVPGAVDPRFAPNIHAALAGSSPYRAQWEAPQAVTGNALRARGTGANAVAISVFTWVPSPKGLAGYFYLVAARERDYRQKQNDFARILQSFRIISAQTGANTVTAEGPGGVRYVRFSDPREGAFTMDVPADWKTEGGLFRFHALDTRHCVQTESPDGQIKILFGDPLIGPFIDPRSLTIGFFPEGSTYAPYGFKMLVLRFMPGTEFCRYWLLTRVSPNCSNLQITETKDLTDQLPQPAPGSISPPPTYGGAWFQCSEQGQPRAGRCWASTQMAGAIGRWLVNGLTGYSAPPDKVSMAEAIHQHMAGSLQWNVQWRMAQVGVAGEASRAVSGASNDIANMVARSQRARDAIDDELARRRSNATLGVVEVADPQTGRRMTVESGSNYYWIDQRGVIAGTNTDTRPSVDFRALLALP
jgi:hypothetical protein